MTADVRSVLASIAIELASLSSGGPTERLAGRFVEAVDRSSPRACEASRVGVVDRMQPVGPPIRDALLGLTPVLPWRPSHRRDDGGEGLALLDFGECLDLGSLTVGAMAVAPHDTYPVHNHPPLEMYYVLGGTADWRFGGAEGFVTRRSGDLVVNHPNDPHSMRTADEALLAVYVLDT